MPIRLRGRPRGLPVLARTAWVLTLAVCCSACKAPVQHTGARPLGSRRPYVEADGRTLADLHAGRVGSTAGDGAGQAVDETVQRVGVADTRLFHRGDCRLLADVERARRVLFVHAYDALDGGYAPCDDCAPLR